MAVIIEWLIPNRVHLPLIQDWSFHEGSTFLSAIEGLGLGGVEVVVGDLRDKLVYVGCMD